MHSISRFHQLVNLLPRSDFERSVREHRSDRHCKGFRSWDQLLVMLFAQLRGSRSLRDVQTGFNLHKRHHYHLATREVRRSTLADANEGRNPQPFVDLARTLMAQCGQRLRRERAELTYLLDATSITLKGRGFDEWTKGNGTRFCQGVKLHVIYESQSRTPLVADFTAANVNDVTAAQQLSIDQRATYVFDKGYTDYNWWHEIDQAGARFVTRFKVNAALKTVREIPVEQADREVIGSDSIVRFANPQPRGGCRNHYTGELRRLVIRRPDGKSLVLATNDLKARCADRPALPRTLADRAVLPLDQAEPEDQELLRPQPERGAHPGLYGLGCLPAGAAARARPHPRQRVLPALAGDPKRAVRSPRHRGVGLSTTT